MTAEPMDLTTPQQFKALAHPTRHRLLFALDRPATISQLAVALDTHKGNVAHHLKPLVDAGLVVLSATRQVRGGTERYYARAAPALRISGPASTTGLPDLLGAVAEEMAAAQPDPLLMLRHVRLTRRDAAELTVALTAIVDRAETGSEEDPRYGLLVGLYQQSPHTG